jgi:hypothetical protein
MAAPSTHNGIIRFGPFQVDLAAREVRKAGRKVKLQEQPFRVLALPAPEGGSGGDARGSYSRHSGRSIHSWSSITGSTQPSRRSARRWVTQPTRPQFIETLSSTGISLHRFDRSGGWPDQAREERRNRIWFGLLAGASVLAIASIVLWIYSTSGRRAPPASGIYLAVLPFTI